MKTNTRNLPWMTIAFSIMLIILLTAFMLISYTIITGDKTEKEPAWWQPEQEELQIPGLSVKLKSVMDEWEDLIQTEAGRELIKSADASNHFVIHTNYYVDGEYWIFVAVRPTTRKNAVELMAFAGTNAESLQKGAWMDSTGYLSTVIKIGP